MQSRIIVLIIIGLFITVAGFAQTNGETPTAPELQLTATQISADETSTAETINGTATPTETSDSFGLTATALIVNATQSGEANGSTSTPDFELTATQLIDEATATALFISASSPPSDNVEDAQALNITFLAIGLVIFALIIIGGGYLVLNSRDEQKLKP